MSASDLLFLQKQPEASRSEDLLPSLATPMLRTFSVIASLLALCVGVYAFDIIHTTSPQEDLILCESSFLSGSALRISEVGFDGTDERIEIANIGDTTYYDTLNISGAKSKLLTFSGFLLDAGDTVIIGDAMDSFSGDAHIIASGQSLSLPDTTGFSLILFATSTVYDSVSFSRENISAISNGITLEAIFSGADRQRFQSDEIRTTLPDSFATPGGVYCFAPSGEPGTGDIGGTGDVADDLGSGDDSSDDGWTGEDSGSGDYGGTGEYTGDDGGDITPSEDVTGSITGMTYPFCSISEIHSVADALPEYIELFCSHAFSGTMIFTGLGVGSSTKTIPIHIDTGSYALLASSTTGFYDTGHMYIVPSISLLDAGETITLNISGYLSSSYTYPSLSKDSSYYPICNTSFPCASTGFASPGFSYLYIASYTNLPAMIVSSPTNTSDSSTNTYYQNLYQTRKAKATQYQKDISALKKDLSSAQKQAKDAIAKAAKSPAVTPVATKTTAKKAVIATIKASTPKVTAKTTAPKSKTVSTTSKAYILLVDEHKLYKSYVAFLHDYLQDHLFTQYKTLKIPNVQSLLKKSLQAVKKQDYTYTIATGKAVSSFDFKAQRKVTTNQKTLDVALQPLSDIFASLMNRIPTSFLEKLYAKYTLAAGKRLSKSDI